VKKKVSMIVMKFGGSLLASSGGIKRAADLVIGSKRGGDDVVVVVSALGDVTDLLLDASKGAIAWDEKKIDRAVQNLGKYHISAVQETALKQSERRQLMAEIDSTLAKLRQTLLGVSILGELSPRSRDMIVSYGERLSAPIVSAEIAGMGVPSSSLTGGDAGIITDSSYGEAIPIHTLTRKAVRKSLLPRLSRGEVPVVSGFIGKSAEGEITTLGRGGSDYTATLLASALGADEVWIWTDVDGILTADPRVVKKPASVSRLSYAEAEELAFFGAKNMHPLALGPARGAHVPVRIRNGFRPDLPGTLIADQQTKSEGVVKVVAVVRNVGLLTVAGETLQGRPGVAAEVFSALADAGVNILMISQSVSEANISMVVRRNSLKTAEVTLRRNLKREGIEVEVSSEPKISVVAAVGAGMRGEKGVAAKVFAAVAARGINVRMIAQGSSELNISFVVDEGDADGAIQALHSNVVDTGSTMNGV
jgi:aspartate kinase